MKKLGNLAKEYDLPIQSHLNENKEEISMVKDEFPNESYTAVYDKHNLLNDIHGTLLLFHRGGT